jgi:kumamolisin
VRTSKTVLMVVVLVFAVVSSVMAQSEKKALPYPHRHTPKAVDIGSLKAQAGTEPLSVTLALHMPVLNEAEQLLTALHTPGNPQYHQFLTSEQFATRFAPKDADVAKVVAALGKYGLTAERTTATTLRVTGAVEDLERAFSVSLHRYAVAGQGNEEGYTFHAPQSRPTVPGEIEGAVAGVVGLDSRPSLRPMNMKAPATVATQHVTRLGAASGNIPGLWTVTDFANYYDVTPLYNRGATGKGHTVGIMTLASFTPGDAYAYWSAVGLAVDANRIRIVNVDGGPGAPSDASGSVETTIDVEQAGGLAPGAKVFVYQAPNTNQGFVDLFAEAIETNRADTLSVSWGFWEWYQNLENSPVTDPITGNTVGITQAFHELLVRAAIQGQSLFSAAGDSGAFDINGDFGCFPTDCSLTLSVDNPSSDTAITAMGGTTLPGLQEYCLNAACTPPFLDINVAHEQVWGWDYLEPLCQAFGLPDPIACGIFPGGGGGGVSIIFGRPSYQYFLPGVKRSQPGQNWVLGGELVYALPANFAGRNVPDISFNADPQTGYQFYYTSDQTGFGIGTFLGGTSFGAPQMNGLTSLLGDYLHERRLGLLNYALYGLAHSEDGYEGSGAPLRVISHGDNWFYTGRNGYSPAAGLGVLDVANLANFLRREDD